MSKAKRVLEASEAAQRLVLPAGEFAKAVPCGNGGSGVALIFSDGSELTIGKVSIDYAAWTAAGEHAAFPAAHDAG